MKLDPWTPDQEDQLIALWHIKTSYDRIAVSLGMTKGQISGRVNKLQRSNQLPMRRGAPA